MANDASIGIINEQGFVVNNAGLGWAPLPEAENKVINEADKKNADNSTVINEEGK